MQKIGAELVHPTPILCTDNAVMIACRGYFMYQAGMRSTLDLERSSIVKFRLNKRPKQCITMWIMWISREISLKISKNSCG